MSVKSHCDDVNQLIEKDKSTTAKNKTGRAKFTIIGCPPQLVVITWVSWLNPASCCAKNLPEMKEIQESFEETDVLVIQAKVSLLTTGLATQLLKSKDQYENVVNLIETTERAKHPIEEEGQAI